MDTKELEVGNVLVQWKNQWGRGLIWSLYEGWSLLKGSLIEVLLYSLQRTCHRCPLRIHSYIARNEMKISFICAKKLLDGNLQN